VDAFHAVLIAGLFHRQGGTLVALSDGNTTVVHEMLDPCEGDRVKCVVQFVPPRPPMLKLWGAGSCLWQPAECPAGHHEHPGKMLNFSQSGTLRHEGERWWLEDDEASHELPLSLLDGHWGRLIVVSDLDPAGLQVDAASAEVAETLTGDLQRVREVLRRLQSAVREG